MKVATVASPVRAPGRQSDLAGSRLVRVAPEAHDGRPALGAGLGRRGSGVEDVEILWAVELVQDADFAARQVGLIRHAEKVVRQGYRLGGQRVARAASTVAAAVRQTLSRDQSGPAYQR